MYYNHGLKELSRELRKNMTDAERFLWPKIRKKQIKGHQVYRQKIIGNYIVDFYCPRAKLIIELDGGQHYQGIQKEKDLVRSGFLENRGFEVLRFSNREVFENIDGVLECISAHL